MSSQSLESAESIKVPTLTSNSLGTLSFSSFSLPKQETLYYSLRCLLGEFKTRSKILSLETSPNEEILSLDDSKVKNSQGLEDSPSAVMYRYNSSSTKLVEPGKMKYFVDEVSSLAQVAKKV